MESRQQTRGLNVHTAAEEGLRPSHKHDRVSTLKLQSGGEFKAENGQRDKVSNQLLSEQRIDDPVVIFCSLNLPQLQRNVRRLAACLGSAVRQTHRKREKQINSASFSLINLHF